MDFYLNYQMNSLQDIFCNLQLNYKAGYQHTKNQSKFNPTDTDHYKEARDRLNLLNEVINILYTSRREPKFFLSSTHKSELV